MISVADEHQCEQLHPQRTRKAAAVHRLHALHLVFSSQLTPHLRETLTPSLGLAPFLLVCRVRMALIDVERPCEEVFVVRMATTDNRVDFPFIDAMHAVMDQIGE